MKVLIFLSFVLSFLAFSFSAVTAATASIGRRGPRGVTGQIGLQGVTGPMGDTGSTGAIGSVGDTGPSGEMGATGPTGPMGDTGSTGAIGSVGVGLTSSFVSVGPYIATPLPFTDVLLPSNTSSLLVTGASGISITETGRYMVTLNCSILSATPELVNVEIRITSNGVTRMSQFVSLITTIPVSVDYMPNVNCQFIEDFTAPELIEVIAMGSVGGASLPPEPYVIQGAQLYVTQLS